MSSTNWQKMSKKVLIVDDNEDTRAIYEHCSTNGVEITVAAGGESALKLLDEGDFDAALLDLSMIPLDGLTMAQEIRRNEQMHSHKTPVHLAFFTARVIDETVMEIATETGVEMIFQKPCDPFELIERICVWLNSAPYFTEKINHRQKENGSSPAYWMIILVALGIQVFTVSLCLLYINKQDVASAYQFTRMKSERDQLKKICDDNSLLSQRKDKFIENNNLKSPLEITGYIPCQAATEEK